MAIEEVEGTVFDRTADSSAHRVALVYKPHDIKMRKGNILPERGLF